jgi:hypothetical protein
LPYHRDGSLAIIQLAIVPEEIELPKIAVQYSRLTATTKLLF